MSQEIFVALSTFAEYGDAPLKLLKDSGIPFSCNQSGRRLNREEIVSLGKEATGIIAGVEPYDAFVLNQLPKLQCISRCGVGIDNIDLELAKNKGIVIRNTPDVVIQPVVEHTIALIFDLLRKVTYHSILLKSKKWEKSAGNLLAGKKAGILGLGRIGRRVAEVLGKLECDVYGTDINPDMNWAATTGVKIVSLEELLSVSDILSLHLSSAKGQPLKFGESEISIMKRGAFLINVARGQFIDETALYNALRNGQLEGAALDVFPEEPYNGKLCDLDNIVMTPHIATLTIESRLQMEIEAVQNMIDSLPMSSQ